MGTGEAVPVPRQLGVRPSICVNDMIKKAVGILAAVTAFLAAIVALLHSSWSDPGDRTVVAPRLNNWTLEPVGRTGSIQAVQSQTKPSFRERLRRSRQYISNGAGDGK